MSTNDPNHPLLRLAELIPEGWNQSRVFRSVFRAFLGTDNSLTKLFNGFEDIIHECVMDRNPWMAQVSADELVQRELAGLCNDLDHSAGYLAHLAMQLAESPNHPGEILLAPRLAEIVQRLRAVTAELRVLVPEESPVDPQTEAEGAI